MDYSNRTTWLFLADHLGSPKVKTAVNGTEAERWDHYPHGETWVTGTLRLTELHGRRLVGHEFLRLHKSLPDLG